MMRVTGVVPLPDFNEKKGLEGYQSFELVGVRMRFGLKTTGEDFESMNVVGMVPGTDAAVSGEYVTLGAHLDHVKPLNGQVCNGADHDASGSVGILEIAEAIAQQPTRRSVVFSLYTAEESGLLGSRFFVANCPIPVKSIMVNLNLDMIGRSDSSARESRKHYVIGWDKTTSELRKLIDSVNSVTVKWPLDFESEDRSMAGSDHMSFHREGIPVAFFFSGRHSTDTPEAVGGPLTAVEPASADGPIEVRPLGARLPRMELTTSELPPPGEVVETELRSPTLFERISDIGLLLDRG